MAKIDTRMHHPELTLIMRCFNEMRHVNGMRRTVNINTTIERRASGMCHPVKQPMFPLTNHLYKRI